MKIKQKHIDACREARLWVRDIVIPVAGVTLLMMSNPEAKASINNTMEKAKEYMKNKFPIR